MRDFSRTGLSFFLEDGSLLFRIGDIVQLKFFSLEKEVHSGPSTIIHVQDEFRDGKVISRIGCHFDVAMDISSVIRGDMITMLKNEYVDFIQSLAVEDNLDEEFVHLTSHFHYLLSSFQSKLRQEEEKISQEDEQVRKELLETLRMLSFDALNEVTLKYSDHFTRITSSFVDSKQHFIHREHFQKTLNELLLKSSLFNRAYRKPLGYAGDYEMMNIIYRNEFEGEDLFSQVMSKIDCQGSAAQAVRNRREYFLNKISSLYQGMEEGSSAKILSVACGPCVELADFLASVRGTPRPVSLEIVAMDQDPIALEDARKRLLPLVEGNETITLRFIQDNIRNLILGKKIEEDRYSNADLIYTAGLCDYLSAKATSRLINEIYRYLRPGGRLIIGNFGTYNPQRFKMEYGAEWFLIHRSEEELKELSGGLPEDAPRTVEKESEGVNLFLNAVKPLEND